MRTNGSNVQQQARRSTFVAVGALLGVEILRIHAEHVVALDAHTMKYARGIPRHFAFVQIVFGRSLGLVAHLIILT
jgi:hypothetical protein